MDVAFLRGNPNFSWVQMQTCPTDTSTPRLHTAQCTHVCGPQDASCAPTLWLWGRGWHISPTLARLYSDSPGQRLRSRWVPLVVSGPEPLGGTWKGSPPTSSGWPGSPPLPLWSCSGPAGPHSFHSGERRAHSASRFQKREDTAGRPD